MIVWPVQVDGFALLELLGVWAAAVATFAASWIALHIAGKQDDVRLEVRVIAGLTGGDGTEFTPVIWVTVTNIARRTATISYVGWRSSRFVKTRTFQIVDPPNMPLPVKLLDGERWSLVFPVERVGRANFYELLAEKFLSYTTFRRKFEVRRFRFELQCSTGEVFERRPDSEFLKKLDAAIAVKLQQKNEGTKP